MGCGWRDCAIVGFGIALSTLSAETVAQSYPVRPITIIAATTPGSLPDILARGVGQRLAAKWKQPVVVENRGGGAHAIAAAAVANAAADGHTLLVTESGFYTIQPHLSKGRAAYAQTDFVPVSGIARIPTAFVANLALEARSIPELIALAKTKPASINYGTAGPGTAPHMGMLLFEHLAKVNLTAVHYRGMAPALNDLIAGHIQLLAIGPTIAIPAFKAGTVKILAVGSERPIPQLEGVPTVAESVPGFEMSVSFSIFVRYGTPQDTVRKINADVQEIVRDVEFQKQFLEPQALQPMQGTAQVFSRVMEAESEKWAKLLRETSLVIE
jgi:tripartite-type tricarboxylate transporter receptor subunit TctC